MAERLSVEQDVVGSRPTSLPLVSLFDEFTSKTEILLRNKEKKEIKNRKFNKFSSNKRKKDSILMSLFLISGRGAVYTPSKICTYRDVLCLICRISNSRIGNAHH